MFKQFVLILEDKHSPIKMKRFIVIASLFLIIGCKTKQTTVEAVRPSIAVLKNDEIPANLKDKAYSLGKRVLMTCNTSRFKPFTSDEATASVIKNTTQERLTKVCHKFRVKYGDFKEIYLEEVLKNSKANTYIFRYKAKYERDFAKKELRVTMDQNQKVAAIKSTDWVDQLN